MNKHTPGPWSVSDRTSITAVWPEGEVQIASMATSRWSDPNQHLNQRMFEQMPANAMLIAAAPDLLDTCKELTMWLESARKIICDEDVDEGDDEEARDVIVRAKTAIAKAEGKSNG